jgi:hypothetical protein
MFSFFFFFFSFSPIRLVHTNEQKLLKFSFPKYHIGSSFTLNKHFFPQVILVRRTVLYYVFIVWFLFHFFLQWRKSNQILEEKERIKCCYSLISTFSLITCCSLQMMHTRDCEKGTMNFYILSFLCFFLFKIYMESMHTT